MVKRARDLTSYVLPRKSDQIGHFSQLKGSCCPQPGATGRAEPTPGFVNGGRCRPASADDLPTDAGCVTSADATAPGGAVDTLTVYARVGTDRRPLSWHLRLDRGSSPIEQRLDAGTRFSYPRVVGGTDIDGDGEPEWIVKTLDLAGHGTAWQALTIFVVRHDRLQAVKSGGEPLDVRVGGVSRMGEGLGCADGGLVLLRAEAQNPRNRRWQVSARTLALTGTEARPTGRDVRILTVTDYNDPALRRLYRVDCNGLRYTT